MNTPNIPHWPTEDPRRLYQQRVAQLETQTGPIEPLSEFDISLAGLKDRAALFKDGTLNAYTLCQGAMHVYWAVSYRGPDLPHEARHNLATLGHDVGVAAEMEFDELETMWAEVQSYQQNPPHKQYLN